AVSLAPSPSPNRFGARGVVLSTQGVEQGLRRLSIGLHPEPPLDGGDGRLGAGTAIAVDLALIVTELLELRLQFELLDDVECAVGARPALLHAAVPGDLVGQEANAKSVAVRRVVALDDEEVARHQECRAVRAGHQLQLRPVAAAREALAVWPLEAECGPLGKRLGLAVILCRAAWQGRLIAPGLAGLPAVLLEQIGGGCQRIGNGIPYVGAAVA